MDRFTVSGTFNWSGGIHTDAGTTVIASGATLSITAQLFLDGGRTLQINSGATATMGAGAQLIMNPNTNVENAGSFNANATETTGPAIYRNNGGSGQLFHNTGTFTRNGTGAFGVTVPFDNDGTANATAGRAEPDRLAAPGTTTG